MFKLIYPILALSLFISCSKKSDNTFQSDPVVVIKPDTLSTGWAKVSAGSTKTFNDIFFVDNNNGFACGESGIYKSSDGGVNWSQLSSSVAAINIAAINANKACFVDNSFKIYHTTDGITIQGATNMWNDSSTTFRDAFFSSSNICYLSSGMYIWKSINGGISFDTIYNFHESIIDNNTLYFVNDLTGWINRQGKIYKTTDGGISWNLQFNGTQNLGVAINFINASTGFVSVDNTIYKTTDGGTHFYPIGQNIHGSLIDISFVSDLIGYVSNENHIYKTTDGGTTWTQIVAVGSPQTIYEIHFTDANHGWACGSNGLLLRFNQ